MLTAKAAYVLGIRQDARAYRQLAKEIKAAFRQKYFDSKGNLTVKTQTAMVLALYFKLAPKSARKKIAGELKEKHPVPRHASDHRLCGDLLSLSRPFRDGDGSGSLQSASPGGISRLAL